MKKKLLSTLLAICMIITLLPVMAMAAPAFPDMPKDYSTAALENAVANGLLKGAEGKILPDANLKRAEMAAVTNRAFGAAKQADITKFKDVAATAWYFADMCRAVQMQTLKGDGVKLNPEAFITREQTFAVLARSLKLKDGTAAELSAFGDAGSVSTWAIGSTAAMIKSGFVHGANGNINPQAYISRKDFAVVMDNIIKNYITTAGEVTSVKDGTVMVNVPGVTLKNLNIKGDLIIGDGVGDGDITLDNVKVSGRTIVRGGGVNSVIVRGSSDLGSVTVSKMDGAVRVSVQGDAKVQVVYIDDGKDDVFIEGKVGAVTVSTDTPVTLRGVEVKTVTATVENANITVDNNSKVETVASSSPNTTVTVAGAVTTVAGTKEAGGLNVNVSAGGTATNVVTAAPNTTLTNDGKVGQASFSADATDAKIVVGSASTIGKVVNENKANLTVTTAEAEKAAKAEAAAKAAADKAAADKIAAEKAAANAKTEAEKAAAAAAKKAADEAAAKAAAEAKAAADAAAAAKAAADKVQEETNNKTEVKPVEPPKAEGGGTVTVPEQPKPTPEPPVYVDPYTHVTTADGLTEALAGTATMIQIDGTIGGPSGNTITYDIFIVNRAVTIKGGTVYGSFIVGEDGVTFDGVSINNMGDNTAKLADRNAINAYCKTLTIKNCVFTSGSEFANGVVIFPSATDVTYNITGNTFTGYINNSGEWNTTGLLITDGFALSGKAFFGEEIAAKVAAKATITEAEELAFMSGNTYSGCSMSYRHSSWTEGNSVNKGIATYINNTELTTFPDLATGGKYYIGASMTITNKTVPANAELIINKGATLTIPANVTLTVTGTIVNNGTIVVNDVTALKMAMNSNTDIGTVKLGSNITVAKADCLAENGWALVESFHGTLDGNNKQLISTVTANVTLAGNARGTATFKNINLVQNGTNVLILAYVNHGSLTFNNVDVTRSEVGSVECGNNESSYVGINYADVDFTACDSAVNYVDTAKTQHAAIFIGGYTYALDGKSHHATFTNCTNSGNMSGKDVALFVGNDNHTAEKPITQTITVANCSNTGIFLGAHSSAPFTNLSGNNVFGAVVLTGLTGKDETKFMTVTNIVTGAIDSTTKAISVSKISGGAVAKYYTTLSVYGIDETSGTYMITISVPQIATGATGLYQAKFITKTAFEALNTGATKVVDGIPAGTVITDNFAVELWAKDNVRYYVFDSVTHDTRTYSFGANGTLPTVSFYAYDSGNKLIGYGVAS